MLKLLILLVCGACADAVHLPAGAAASRCQGRAPAASRRGGRTRPLVMDAAQGPSEIDFSAAYRNRIDQLVTGNKVFLFMKGNKLFPQCGFSDTAVKILNAVEADFETFDVLSDSMMRETIKTYTSWPTIPQCFVGGEFIGGCDIMIEMYQSGELKEMLAEAEAEAGGEE